MKRILIKAIKPHRQKIMTESGEEMKLQQWANRAAGALEGSVTPVVNNSYNLVINS